MNTETIELTDYRNTGVLSEADRGRLLRAAELLRGGGLVAFPTETVYGLGGNALLRDASKRIYAAKGRPSDNPLIVHIASLEALPQLVKEIPERAKRLAAAFWPGPLTMIMERSALVPYETTGGLETVAVRMPEHPAALCLIAEAGVPVAAPSANTSGRPSPTEASHVAEDLFGKIDAIVDGGPVEIGVESTIVDLCGKTPVLLRPGAITREMLSEVLSEEVLLDPALEKPLDPGVHPKAPGMKYRHYAPQAPMTIVQPDDGCYEEAALSRVRARVCALTDAAVSEGTRVGLLCSEESFPYYQSRYAGRAEQVSLYPIGSCRSGAYAAHTLFRVLRETDGAGVGQIIAEGVCPEAIGYAVMNRMKKAAGQHVINV